MSSKSTSRWKWSVAMTLKDGQQAIGTGTSTVPSDAPEQLVRRSVLAHLREKHGEFTHTEFTIQRVG